MFEDPVVQEFLSQMAAAIQGEKPAAAIAVLCLFAIRLYRLPVLQNQIPDRARWESLPGTAKVIVPFLLTFVASLLPALLGGSHVLPAIFVAVKAAVGAVILHHGTKALGAVEAKKVEAKHAEAVQAAEVAGAPKPEAPKPSLFRRILSIVVPFRQAKLPPIQVVK